MDKIPPFLLISFLVALAALCNVCMITLLSDCTVSPIRCSFLLYKMVFEFSAGGRSFTAVFLVKLVSEMHTYFLVMAGLG